MRIRGLALGLVLTAATAVQAGTQIRLVPQNVSSNLLNPLGHYLPGEVVNVNVYAVQTPAGPDHLLRLAKFHFDATSPQLAISNIAFGAYSATGHYVDSSLATGPAGIAAAYTFVAAANLGPNPANQLAMLGNGTPALVGSFSVTMPAAAGSYMLDVMNAGGASTDVRAAVTYGFGCAPATPCANGAHPDDVFPVTTDRPGAGLTGGTLALVTNTPTVLVAGVPAIPPQNADVRVTHPLDGGNLWRTQQQVIRIAFTQDIGVVGNLPSCPAIEIRELIAGAAPATGANFAGGTFGANLNVGAAFACGIEADPNQANAPRILRIRDTNPVDFLIRKWYTVQNLGGFAGASPFRLDYRCMPGDRDNNGLINASDPGAINADILAGIGGFNATRDQRRGDIDGNNIINPTDVGASNTNIPMGAFLAKPAGHP
jgi:hypothetical protein